MALLQSRNARLFTYFTDTCGHGVRAFADAECTILPGFARPRAFQF